MACCSRNCNQTGVCSDWCIALSTAKWVAGLKSCSSGCWLPLTVSCLHEVGSLVPGVARSCGYTKLLAFTYELWSLRGM